MSVSTNGRPSGMSSFDLSPISSYLTFAPNDVEMTVRIVLAFALGALLAQSFFMPFALTVLACLARTHSISSQVG